MAQLKQIQTRVPDLVLEELARRAAAEGRSLSGFLRWDLVKRYGAMADNLAGRDGRDELARQRQRQRRPRKGQT